MKPSSLAAVMAPVPFCFNFLIFVHTGHANFDFN